MNKRRSPMDLRDGLEREVLEPYEAPRLLVRQAKVDQFNYDPSVVENRLQLDNDTDNKSSSTGKTWLTKLSTNKMDLKRSLSKRIARLSSLESNRSSSSMELDGVDQQHRHQQQQQLHHRLTPLISITSLDTTTVAPDGDSELPPAQSSTNRDKLQRRRQQEFYRDYYGRSSGSTTFKSAMDEDYGDEDDDDDDAFEDAPLPMPYSSSSRSVVRNQHQSVLYSPATLRQYEELLDDRQGMNNSEQHFTKAEKAQRASIDNSIISEFRIDPKKLAGGGSGGKIGGSHKNKDKRRSKSPSSSSVGHRRRGHSRRGFLGLASRLKLTKKHESIAKLQLYILNSGLISLKTLDRDLQSFLPRERMGIKEFQERVRLMRKYDVLSTIEYRFASKYETYVCKHAQQETNQPKNNYKKCIPYDYNRVVLKTLPQVPDSDYINASHVDSCLKPNAYIAAQGPNENTIDDFWRMIWEQKTFVIVMLTKVFDFIRVMCNQYWPVELNKPERYGNIEVTLLYEEPLADFVIRTIKIAKLKGNLNPPQQTTATTTTSTTAGQNNNAGGEPSTSPTATTTMANDAGLGSGAGAGAQHSEDGNKWNEQRADSDSADGDSDSDDDYDSDETDISEELPILNEQSVSNQNLTVRAPKFIAARVRRRKSRAHEGGSNRSQQFLEHLNHETSPPPPPSRGGGHQRSSSAPRELFPQSDGESGGQGLTNPRRAPKERPTTTNRPANEFLHPLFNSTHLATSLNSLASEPNSPVTPRTPSSAGLDRSSATRKAVKKKRRERVKNQRPKRTQFMVPTESQLLDDDDDDDDDLNNGEPLVNGEGKPGNVTSERIIYQFHYNSWASHTCPFISSLLHFRRRVRICMDEMSKSGRTGPTVVHCNDGCGRTGTYLCIDANLELADEDNVLDIYNYTRKMRQSRKFLIENLEQYKFVYDTIEEAIYCGKTWFPVSELHKRLKHKSQRNPITRKNEYLLEYEKICRMTSKFSIGDCAGGHRVENREKNRDVSTVPPDNFRPYLTSFQTNDSTDYINAVFVDGYTRSKEYIVTEWPLHRTISDFWSLIYDHDCNSVILLANPGESSTYPSFLPSEKELRRRFGPVFSAEMVSYTHYQNIKSWIYTINKKIVSLTEVIAGVKSETKTTQVFQITCWPQGHRVPTSTNALVELMNMVERWRQRTTYGPVCVVSLNGKSRAGVYCAANVAIEQVVQHSEVDVFNAVKTVRRHRPQLIENMTEYKYCYDLILHYVLHYVNRNNDS